VPVVRVPWNDTVTIKRVLDAGATTLLVPFVQNAAEAAAAVAATRYPPQGVRGMAGMSRAARFGMATDHFTTANQGLSVIVQIESLSALAQLEAIAAVDGVDAIFMGPADLSGSMGLVGTDMHPRVMDLMTRAAALPRAGHADRQHRRRARWWPGTAPWATTFWPSTPTWGCSCRCAALDPCAAVTRQRACARPGGRHATG
jgi:2-keto-3-deoxy-L-rhamnonate aldolase RhmA